MVKSAMPLLLSRFKLTSWCRSVERGVDCVKIPRAKVIQNYTQTFAKALEVNDFARSQISYRVEHIGVVYQSDYIVVGCSCLLLGCHVFCQVGDRVAL